ncbi:MAG: hypothetical protein RIT04_2 [Candidatus Parcubacteria bacterium]|jgi:hypothetical protein
MNFISSLLEKIKHTLLAREARSEEHLAEAQLISQLTVRFYALRKTYLESSDVEDRRCGYAMSAMLLGKKGAEEQKIILDFMEKFGANQFRTRQELLETGWQKMEQDFHKLLSKTS